MNRLVLIGNGFDLAHGLRTQYQDFIDWYWRKRMRELRLLNSNVSQDKLCTLKILTGESWNVFLLYQLELRQMNGLEIIKVFKENPEEFKVSPSPFFGRISKSIETKGWVDIENEYYGLLKKFALEEPSSEELNDLNCQLKYVQELLVDYLKLICQKGIEPIKKLRSEIYSPIKYNDISNESHTQFEKYIEGCYKKGDLYWREKQNRYELSELYLPDNIYDDHYPDLFMLPDNILFLNFNYTNTADAYLRKDVSRQIHIHGHLSDSGSIIFGYGDEMDSKYSQLQGLNDNTCLQNIKSIKYLESDNYRKVLRFIESAPFQICIMGHSCGNSDRTLLNTLFEHKNCISIKPYFYKKEDGSDNYLDIVQNISRNFTDMKLMRDRVVNKTYCETIT